MSQVPRRVVQSRLSIGDRAVAGARHSNATAWISASRAIFLWQASHPQDKRGTFETKITRRRQLSRMAMSPVAYATFRLSCTSVVPEVP